MKDELLFDSYDTKISENQVLERILEKKKSELSRIQVYFLTGT